MRVAGFDWRVMSKISFLNSTAEYERILFFPRSVWTVTSETVPFLTTLSEFGSSTNVSIEYLIVAIFVIPDKSIFAFT